MKTIRGFEIASRYKFDFGACSTKSGFAQIDTSQDASFFGTWANPEKLLIFSYIEGDTILQIADTPDEFAKEIRRMKQWNEDCGHRFMGIDPGLRGLIAKRFRSMGLGDLLH